jgi:hypothetical protein
MAKKIQHSGNETRKEVVSFVKLFKGAKHDRS